MATSGSPSLFTATHWEALPPETCEALPWSSSMQRAWPLFFVMALRNPRKGLSSTAFQSTNHAHSKSKKARFSYCLLYHQFNIELNTWISFISLSLLVSNRSGNIGPYFHLQVFCSLKRGFMMTMSSIHCSPPLPWHWAHLELYSS